MTEPSAIVVRRIIHRYGDFTALNGVDLEVPARSIGAVLGPNGSGKTTLFRLISTLLRIQDGQIAVFGHDVSKSPGRVRQELSVVFQSPSLDRELTVWENLACQGRLYGLSRGETLARGDELLRQLHLTERKHDRVKTLSGGLRRRVEIAKALIHHPLLLLMDEPSTGLDPAARIDLWNCLLSLRTTRGTTILLTTHLLEEAEKADGVFILDRGLLAAQGTPGELRQGLGELMIRITSPDSAALARDLLQRFGYKPVTVDGQLRLQVPDAPQAVAEISRAFGDRLDTISLGRPTLEDVFVARTGHQFSELPDGLIPHG